MKENIAKQFAIFKNKHTWSMTALYLVTFGSFIGFSMALPLSITVIFGDKHIFDAATGIWTHLKNPAAPSALTYAWIDSGILEFPLAATYTHNLVNHESGLDNNETATPTAIESYITSSETDIDDGHNFVFIRRILPDMTFRGSTTENPTATLSIIPLMNSGSGYTDPASVGGDDSAAVTRTATVPIEQFTGQVFIRVRGRQFSFKIYNSQLGSMWQLGAIRLDIKQDGQRGG